MTDATPITDKQADSAIPTPADKLANPTLITLEQLASEMKVNPRDARMLLRLAAKQTKLYPTMGKEHVARQPWSWVPGSKALIEAKKALTASADAE